MIARASQSATVIAHVVVLVVGAAYAVEVTRQALTTWTVADMDAYWNAAMRLRGGEALFPAGVSNWAPTVYHYAPWFAWLWVPISHLPYEAVRVGWSLALVVASGYVIFRNLALRSMATVGLILIAGANLLAIASGGNVQPLMVLLLLATLERRWLGPASIAICASLKLAPAMLVAVYVGRRQWDRVLLSTLLTALLMATYLTVDLTHYPRSLPGSLSLAELHTGVWILVSIVVFVAAFAAANKRSPFTWLVAAVGVLVASPRLGYIESTYLLAVAPNSLTDGNQVSPQDRR